MLYRYIVWLKFWYQLKQNKKMFRQSNSIRISFSQEEYEMLISFYHIVPLIEKVTSATLDGITYYPNQTVCLIIQKQSSDWTGNFLSNLYFYASFFNLNAFNTTVKLLIVIAKAAIIGFIVMPNGSKIPIAIGIMQIL